MIVAVVLLAFACLVVHAVDTGAAATAIPLGRGTERKNGVDSTRTRE
jgi:hypothetical protein